MRVLLWSCRVLIFLFLLAFAIKEYAPDGRIVSVIKTDLPEIGGRAAENCRCTRSCGHGAAVSGRVVIARAPRTTPCRPAMRIRRSTVHRATVIPSRWS